MSRSPRRLHPNSLLDAEALFAFFAENDIKELHAKKIWRKLIAEGPQISLDNIENLPKQAATLLNENFTTCTSTMKDVQTSQDGKTSKLLIELQDGNMIESVVIRHHDTRSGGHTVLCVSSQIGCKMGCTFCATGTMGLMGNLTSGEILEQLLLAKHHVDPSIRNVVFMGMGEPLDNYDNVANSIRGMRDRRRFNLAETRITLSTVGVVKRMYQFTDDFPRVNLALSLHAPNQKLRKRIVPSASAYTVRKLLDCVDNHFQTTGNKVFIEYIVIGNVNASPECAEELAQLLGRRKVIVNLIPYNPTEIGDTQSFTAPTQEQLEVFKETVINRGLFCTIRSSTTSGQDIDGACGQLAIKGCNGVRGCSPEAEDIEDIGQKSKRLIVKKKKRRKRKRVSFVAGELEEDREKNAKRRSTVQFVALGALACIAGYVLFRSFSKSKKENE